MRERGYRKYREVGEGDRVGSGFDAIHAAIHTAVHAAIHAAIHAAPYSHHAIHTALFRGSITPRA